MNEIKLYNVDILLNSANSKNIFILFITLYNRLTQFMEEEFTLILVILNIKFNFNI